MQQTTNIVELIAEHVSLKPRGKEHVGLCPFHEDSSPSMYVSPTKQIFKCFACGAGGDVFSFVMKYHKMDFREALEHLAQRAGIEIKRDPAARQASSERQQIAQANDNALKFFRAMLSREGVGDSARSYLQERHISDEMIQRFQVGYAPEGWDHLVRAIQKKQWDTRAMAQAGLLKTRDNGGHYDAFRNRLIFPILDRLGRPIAFGGRKLNPEDEPKYLNSPETPLFHKSKALYGIHAASQAILSEHTAVIVEGYTDVIACHQAGFANVVATLGTALTKEHASELRRYAERVVLVFDGDEAGQKAADRGLEVFLTADVDVAIAVLPGGQDPADLLNQPDGAEQWQNAIDQATGALTYQLKRLSATYENAGSITGKQQAVEGFLQRLGELGLRSSNPLRRGEVFVQISELTHVRVSEIEQMFDRLKPKHRRPVPMDTHSKSKRANPAGQGRAAVNPDDLNAEAAALAAGELDAMGAPDDDADLALESGVSATRIRALQRAERELIGALLVQSSLFAEVMVQGQHLDEAITPVDLFTHPGRKLYQRMFDILCAGEPLTLASLTAALAEKGEGNLSDLAVQCESEAEEKTTGDPARLHELCTASALALLRRQNETAYQEEKAQLRDADDVRKLAALRDRLGQSGSPVRIMRVRK